MVTYFRDSAVSSSVKSILENHCPPAKEASKSLGFGSGYRSTSNTGFIVTL